MKNKSLTPTPSPKGEGSKIKNEELRIKNENDNYHPDGGKIHSSFFILHSSFFILHLAFHFIRCTPVGGGGGTAPGTGGAIRCCICFSREPMIIDLSK